MSNDLPKLVPGPAFHLEGDGKWDVQKLPDMVLKEAEYSGSIKIRGYPAVVFITKSGDTWAQKAPGTPSPKGDDAAHEILEQIAARLIVASHGKLNIFGPEEDMDDDADFLEVLHFLNGNGFKTHSSCAGHPPGTKYEDVDEWMDPYLTFQVDKNFPKILELFQTTDYYKRHNSQGLIQLQRDVTGNWNKLLDQLQIVMDQ
jgi:hypothetical protein